MGLKLRRKVGEFFAIDAGGQTIVITVVEACYGRATFDVDAPDNIRVARSDELLRALTSSRSAPTPPAEAP